ncbi:MAG: hypothetical protein ACXVXZ_00205 [Mycobacteriaceae bacterium]
MRTDEVLRRALPSAHVLTAVVFVPTPPLLVPELVGCAAEQTQALRDACLSAVGTLAEVSNSWVAIGAHGTDLELGPDARGSWSSFGADVAVSLGPNAHTAVDPALPLPALVAGWLRAEVAPQAAIRLRLYARDTPRARCVELGRLLGADPENHALLVLGDGCTTLTAKAPGALDERAATVQDEIDHGLSTVDRSAIMGLDATLCSELGVSGRVPWQVAVSAVGDGWRARSLYCGAQFGVGYQVATWVR